ncbi:MAG: type II toxin-antitoxin system PemK/MazF family toxin [Magnetococcales bacterium]|nr:type II toxin-antitoxin system PemK/MazF family toxin [Magnetococcales bacterium]
MKHEGQVVLTALPNTDLSMAKLRPVLLLRRVSIRYDDWLVCMVSSRIWQAEAGLDEIISPDDHDFPETGLKGPSVVRISRLAVLNDILLVGSMGAIGSDRLDRIRQRLAKWIVGQAAGGTTGS